MRLDLILESALRLMKIISSSIISMKEVIETVNSIPILLRQWQDTLLDTLKEVSGK